MPKITIVAAVYPPEPIVAGRMCRDLAVALAEKRYCVTVLCPFPSRPSRAVYPVFDDRARVKLSTDNGVSVARLPSFTAPQSALLPRLRESLSFGRQAASYLFNHLPDSDVLYDMSWPMFGQDMVSRTAQKLRLPLVMSVQDAYPESWLRKLPLGMRVLFGPPLRTWDRKICQRASTVVVPSQSMFDLYRSTRGLGGQQLVLVPNWQDERPFLQTCSRANASLRYGTPTDSFTFLFLGNIGPVAGVEGLITGFREARLDHAQLIIAGDGSARRDCQRLAAAGPNNIHFISDADSANTAQIHSVADVFLLPLKRGASLSSAPSKLIAYLLSAKPILAAVDADSEPARIIRSSECGWVTEPGDSDQLARQMRDAMTTPAEERQAMGERARNFGLTHFSRQRGLNALTDIILGQIRN